MRHASVLAACCLLALPGVAAAKQPPRGSACGVDRCIELRAEAVSELTAWWTTPFQAGRAPRPAPFFRLEVSWQSPEAVRWSLVYLPARSAMRFAPSAQPPYRTAVRPYWRQVPAEARGALERMLRGLTPFPARTP